MKFSKELAVGFSLVVAAIIFVLGIRYFDDLPLFRGTYQLNTAFEDVSGLQPGNAVRVNGVRVGAVDEVRLDAEGGQVLVRFHVDKEIAIPEGSYSTLGGIAALGSIYLSIELGPPGSERMEDGGFIPSHAATGVLESVTERAPALANSVESVLANANQTLEQTELVVGNTGGDIRETLTTFRSAATSLETLIRAQQASLSATLNNLEGFSANLNTLSDENADSVALAMQNLNRAMARLNSSLTTLEASTNTLDEILYKMNEGEGTLALLLNDPGVYTRLDSSLSAINSILADFQADPRKYLRHLSLVELF